ncbi:MAG: NifU family protein [Chloroflexi bacterium]|nr:NifU family protein [Chloroflexota bacterium]MCI0476449.1 NifU family protein [Anaerolineales bacterium]
MATPNEYERMAETIQTISHYAEIYHNGKVDLVSYDGETVIVHLGGACEGCPLMPWTLHRVIESTVRDLFPKVKEVKAV